MREGYSHFNLRVYGLLQSENNVLTVHETHGEHSFLKFPGGGLEYGEGLEECLKREFQEEMAISIEVGKLFYVNSFFQASAFKKEDQLIAFYFLVHTDNWNRVNHLAAGKAVELDTKTRLDYQWQQCDEQLRELLTFPVDKVVGDRLIVGDEIPHSP